ncbi:MAG: QueT transporter family protein [Pygmaiobacter sp.]
MKNFTQRQLVRCAMIAALYTAISLALAPLSYNAVQIRVAEALCLLPVFVPDAIIGVTLGCLLTNLLGSTPIDAVFGTLASLLAAMLTYRLRHVRWHGLPIASAFSPVVCNAIIISAEITLFFSGGAGTAQLFLLNAATVGLGEVISCVGLGLLLVKGIEKNPALRRAMA